MGSRGIHKPQFDIDDSMNLDLWTVTTWELTLTDARLNPEPLHASTSLTELRANDTK